MLYTVRVMLWLGDRSEVHKHHFAEVSIKGVPVFGGPSDYIVIRFRDPAMASLLRITLRSHTSWNTVSAGL